MAVEDATQWYQKLPGDPDVEYITPSRATLAVEQIYQDMPTGAGDGSVWHVGNGAPPDGLGKPGDLYLDRDTFDVWRLS